MSRSRLLYNLQQIDTKIYRARTRIAKIEAILEQDNVLQRAIQDKDAKKQVLIEKEKALKKAEINVKDQRAKIKQKTSQLYGGAVTNPKELGDLQQQVDSLERYLDVLEERQLEAMLETDEAKEIHADAAQILAKIRAERDAQHKELMIEKTELEKQIKTSLEERPNFLLDILPEDLDLYEKLRKSRGGIAVAATLNESCAACGTNIPSALYQIARSPSQIAQCSTCKRILHGR